VSLLFFVQAEDGIRDFHVTGVQTCALPIFRLIGATTENPSFEVNAALLSRCQVFTLNALGKQELEKMLHLALEKDVDLKKRDIRSEERRVGREGRTQCRAWP